MRCALSPSDAHPITGRCYCGQTTFNASARPQTTSYCHCSDCRRLSSAPVAAFAAFAPHQVHFTPSKGPRSSVSEGVDRWFCQGCGTQLAATYDYLPDQVYVPLGIIDQVDTLPPEGHSHTDSAVTWLHIQDEAPRDAASARDRLQDKTRKG